MWRWTSGQAAVSTEARRGATHRFTSGPSLLARLISRCRFWKCSTRVSMGSWACGMGDAGGGAGCKSVEAQSGRRVDTGARGEKFARQAQRNARQRSGDLAGCSLAAHVMACQRAVDQSQSRAPPSPPSDLLHELGELDEERDYRFRGTESCMAALSFLAWPLRMDQENHPESRRDGPRSCICSRSQTGHAWRPSIRQRHQDVIRVDT